MEPLKEMCKIVQDKFADVIPCKKEMVKIVNNGVPRKGDMVKVVNNGIPIRLLPVLKSYDMPPSPLLIEENKIVMYNDDDNVFRYVDGKLYYLDTALFNGYIEITGVLLSEDENYYKCRICIKNTFTEKQLKISDFSKGNWVFGVPGVAFFVSRNKANELLFAYLQSLINNFDIASNQHFIYKKPGWKKINNNKYIYLTIDGAIGNMGMNSVSKFGQKFKNLYVNDSSKYQKYLKMMDITNSDTGPILILYTAMSLCYELFKEAGYVPKFSLFLNGPRGNYKTSLALAVTQIEYKNSPEYTLKSTKSGLETAFKIYKDAVFLVDDLAPVQIGSDRRVMQSNLELIVRAYGDGTGIKRNLDFLDEEQAKKIEQYVAEGGAIITGEYTTGCESSLARSLFLELKKEDVNLNLLSEFQTQKTIVSDFAVIFITNLIFLLNETQEDLIGFIRENVKKVRAEYKGNFSNERYAEYIGQLITITNILILIGNKFNLISPEESEYFYNRFLTAIRNVVTKNSNRLIKESPITIICNAIVTSIEEGIYPIINITTIAGDKVIYQDNTNFYLTQKLCSEIVNTYIKENNLNTSEVTSTYVADLLSEAGVITVFAEGRTNRKSKKIAGHGSVRYMFVNKQKIYELAKF